MKTKLAWLAGIAALGLGACATVPPAGPSVMVLPRDGGTFEQFRYDQAICEQYARDATGNVMPVQAAEASAVNSAAVGTAIGAATGAVIGAASGDPGQGAAVGAGVGMLGGTLAGIDAYNRTAADMQDRYDTAFVQCMYAKGHQVPVPAGYIANTTPRSAPPPPNAPPRAHPLPPPPTPGPR
ncbi:MAG: hypothetical protein HYY48_12805 [Gammaproteobacteria bacterium]|nr:hypothetical protein [Gammaproteobacteria bacterium]